MTAQLPSKVRLAQIASFSKSMALPPSHDEIEAMARALLAAHEQEPVAYKATHLDSFAFGETKSAVEAHAERFGWELAFTEITPLYTHPAPVPAVPDDWKGHLTCTHCTPKSVSQVSTGTSVGVAPVPAVQDFDTWFKREFHPDKTGPYVKDQMRFCWNACRAAMLKGGKPTHDEWRSSLQELVKAMRDYEMDVDEPAPYKHREMMRRAEALLNGGKS